jgi:hypothetical protein
MSTVIEIYCCCLVQVQDAEGKCSAQHPKSSILDLNAARTPGGGIKKVIVKKETMINNLLPFLL